MEQEIAGGVAVLQIANRRLQHFHFRREMEVQWRRGTTSPDPEKIPEPLRGPLGGFPVGIPREEKNPLRASKGQFSSERLSEAFPPLVLHLRSSSTLCRFGWQGSPANPPPPPGKVSTGPWGCVSRLVLQGRKSKIIKIGQK